MLTQLRIANLAQLATTTLDLGPGLTAITGETGAGKTMVLTAVRLLTGGRADARIVSSKADRTEVDASARVDELLAEQLEAGGFTVEDGEAFFSRTVLSKGGSRAAISGRPVPAKSLAETLGSQITVHGQSDQWRLRTSKQQRSLLDRFAGRSHLKTLEEYRDIFSQSRDMERQVAQAEAGRDQREVELRYLEESVALIEELDLSLDEEEQLEAAIDRLTNVEALHDVARKALSDLGGEGGAEEKIGQAAERLDRASHLDGSLEDFAKRMVSLESEAQSLASDLRDYGGSLFEDPDELARLHDRRAALTEVMRGRAVSVPELLTWLDASKERIEDLRDESHSPDALRQELRNLRERAERLGLDVSKSRKVAGAKLEKAVERELQHLALKDARFVVSLDPAPASYDGLEAVNMLLASHPGSPPAPLGDGVSGGELSRIMLALEVVLTRGETPDTMVFDEIDAGIGGEVANQLAARLKRLAKNAQVLVVTHLPQVAAVADANFAIKKKDGEATVRQVEGEEKISELVRMLGGDPQDLAARQMAEAMTQSTP